MSTVLGPARSPRELPTIRTALAPDEILARLDKASRRGRMPGYAAGRPGSTPGGFTVSAFSEPFDHELDGAVSNTDSDGYRTITFRLRMLRKAPAIFAASIVLSLWPGLPILDTMIPSSWGWWPTWTWYLPLCLLPIPFIPRMVSKSRRLGRESAEKAVEAITKELGAAPAGVAEKSLGSASASPSA